MSTDSSKKVEVLKGTDADPSKEARLRELAEVAVLADQFVDEGRITQAEADEVSSISDPEEARERFLEISKARYEASKADALDQNGNARSGQNIDYNSMA